MHPKKLILPISILINAVLILFISYKTSRSRLNNIKNPYNRQLVYNALPIDTNSIVFIGDSQTQYFPIDELFINKNIKNRGIAGDSTAGVFNRITEILKNHPKKIILQIGVNDFYRLRHEERYVIINFKKIINAIADKSPKSQIIVESLLPTNLVKTGTILTYNSHLRTICKYSNIKYLDIYNTFESDHKLKITFDIGDQLHLNGSGYQKWASILKPYIEN
jgi:lysophospholipase L1-like esterase